MERPEHSCENTPPAFLCVFQAHISTFTHMHRSHRVNTIALETVHLSSPVLNESWTQCAWTCLHFLSQKMCPPCHPPPSLTCCTVTALPVPHASGTSGIPAMWRSQFSPIWMWVRNVQMSPVRSELNTLLCFDCVTCHDLIACTKDKSPDLL